MLESEITVSFDVKKDRLKQKPSIFPVKKKSIHRNKENNLSKAAFTLISLKIDTHLTRHI